MPFLRKRGVLASDSDMRRRDCSGASEGITGSRTSQSNTQKPNGVDSPHDVTTTHSSGPRPETSGMSKADDAERSAQRSSLPSLPRLESSGFEVDLDEATPTTAAPQVPAPPATPPSDSPPSTYSVQSSGGLPRRPESPPVQEETQKHRRFSMLRFRNASDSQLSTRAKQQAQAMAQKPPPMPRPPEIITTAPTQEFAPQKKQSRMKLTSRLRKSTDLPRDESDEVPGGSLRATRKDRRRTILFQPSDKSRPSITFDEPKRPKTSNAPPDTVERDSSSRTPSFHLNRVSESSRSDESAAGRKASGNSTPISNAFSTSTSFFRLPRRKPRQPESMFPIGHLQKAKSDIATNALASDPSLNTATPDSMRASTSSRLSANTANPEASNASRPSPVRERPNTSGPSPARALFQKSHASPANALFRPGSHHSGHSSPNRSSFNLRGRSSTLSSLNRDSTDDRLAPPTTRTSSSTGRKSFGDLLGLSRLRQNSEPLSAGRHGAVTPLTPGSNTSKNNSLQLPRESVAMPERREDDTAAKYLARLEEVVTRSVIASALSKNPDTFYQSVLRSYMRSFKFFGDPMDMAIRKLLMEAELPKETQQIDRCLQAFSNRYHECNPGVYASPDQAYFIAFSLLILHTDVFNKNNKHKMQKPDYLKNTRGEGIFDEILEVFYDNISYTPFIHVEEDFDLNGERITAQKAKKKLIFANGSPETKKTIREPIDPYTLIIDNKLDILRPNLKEVMQLEDIYTYMGTAPGLDMQELQKTFFKTGVLQIVSARSRPDAFMTEKTSANPEEAHPGIVDIKITKVGLLWRKDAKKKKTRSPWNEWGAILTLNQLYFFKNTTWVKNLMHQYEQHLKHGNDGIPCIFKPPLEHFKPDSLMSTDGAVALLDSSYKKHKNAFTYVRHGGMEEVVLADNEEEMNDWLAKINYATAFRTSGVRMRGVVGGAAEGQSRRAIRRLDHSQAQSVQTPSGEVMITRSQIDQKMVEDILTARREIMLQKVAEAGEKLQEEERKLEVQLKNARHLQILAPIQPKTREQMLLSAARMAAQLKWTRIEIWKLKCHRDILSLDLEEERKTFGLPDDTPTADSSPEKPDLVREPSKTSTMEQHATPQQIEQQSPSTQTAAQQVSSAISSKEPESPTSEVFQTPPTSATVPSFHRHQKSTDTARQGAQPSFRKTSVSSAMSSGPSILTTPPRKIASSGSASEHKSAKSHAEEVDADERDLLQQAGLLEAPSRREALTRSSSQPFDDSDGADGADPQQNGTGAEKSERSRVRRSLQRTLRDGAGHLSHHRSSRRGKDSAPGGMSEESRRDSDVLTRGTGSFVVHGKKASVIQFGSDLQSFSPDGRLRQRISQQGIPQRDETTSPASSEGTTHVNGDFHAILQSRQGSERRESTTSASTATARSFRDLHRKYSSAQVAKPGGNLTIPSDDDSDAAVSFSEGRRTPLRPLEPEVEEEEEASEDDEDSDVDEYTSPPHSATRQQFFTPEPPHSPPLGSRDADQDDEDTPMAPRSVQAVVA